MRELRRLLIDPARLEAQQQPCARGDQDRCHGEAALPEERSCPEIALLPEESHYLSRVLRLRRDQRLAIGDGQGRLWSARLRSEAAVRLEQPLCSPLEEAPPPHPSLTLAMAVPRRDPEVVWRMAAELGASALQPLLAARSVIRGSLPLERWRSIVREACEQSEQLWLPALEAPRDAEPWLAEHPASRSGGRAFLATTRNADSVPLVRRLLEGHGGSAPQFLSVAIGPEGGWTPAEEKRALAAGWEPVSLGDGILRSSTAAVAALSLLTQAWPHLRT